MPAVKFKGKREDNLHEQLPKMFALALFVGVGGFWGGLPSLEREKSVVFLASARLTNTPVKNDLVLDMLFNEGHRQGPTDKGLLTLEFRCANCTTQPLQTEGSTADDALLIQGKKGCTLERPSKWGRKQMGSDGLNRIRPLQPCWGTPCTSENT